MTESRSARFPWLEGRPTHLPCREGDMPAVVLLPGDPDRVAIAADMLKRSRWIGRRREFAIATGLWQDIEIGVCSSGIGGPSTEIAVIELANIGVKTIIRIGGMGAIDPSLELGQFLIVEGASGGTGTAQVYSDTAGMKTASGQVVEALVAAASGLGLKYRRGVVRTADSYYWGQERPLGPAADAPPTAGLIEAAANDGAAGLEMECETLFAVGAALGIRTGAVLAVHGNRATDRWLEDYEPVQRDLVRLSASAAAVLETTDNSRRAK